LFYRTKHLPTPFIPIYPRSCIFDNVENIKGQRMTNVELKCGAEKTANPRKRKAPRLGSSPLRVSNQGQKLTLTVKEAAARLGIGVERAYEAVAAGQIPTIPLGKRKVVPVAALERMLAGEKLGAPE
jgi:excisionase family DNA binding protein